MLARTYISLYRAPGYYIRLNQQRSIAYERSAGSSAVALNQRESANNSAPASVTKILPAELDQDTEHFDACCRCSE